MTKYWKKYNKKMVGYTYTVTLKKKVVVVTASYFYEGE